MKKISVKQLFGLPEMVDECINNINFDTIIKNYLDKNGYKPYDNSQSSSDKTNDNTSSDIPEQTNKDSVTVKSISILDNVVIPYGADINTIELPTHVNATMNDNSVKELQVSWIKDSFVGKTKVGQKQALTGNLKIDDTEYLNPNKLQCTLYVVENAKDYGEEWSFEFTVTGTNQAVSGVYINDIADGLRITYDQFDGLNMTGTDSEVNVYYIGQSPIREYESQGGVKVMNTTYQDYYGAAVNQTYAPNGAVSYDALGGQDPKGGVIKFQKCGPSSVVTYIYKLVKTKKS